MNRQKLRVLLAVIAYPGKSGDWYSARCSWLQMVSLEGIHRLLDMLERARLVEEHFKTVRKTSFSVYKPTKEGIETIATAMDEALALIEKIRTRG